MERESSEIHPGYNTSKNPVKTSEFMTGIIENMKLSHAWEEGELNAMVLSKKPEKKIVLTAMHKGTKIDSFQANGSVTFQVMEGKLEFRAAKESVMLKKGHLLTLHEKIKYSLKSRKETVFLLTIVPGEFQNTLSQHYA
jgi:quercetin dioxygenase-like cupin family protein